MSQGWLLFFYSVPSKPVSNRVRVWRRLAKAGAIQLKGAVYILPYNEEHTEFFQWLVSEVTSMKGDASFVKVENIETIKTDEIINLFNRQRERDYTALIKSAEELERKISSIRKGSISQNNKKLAKHLNRLNREFGGIRAVDFFSSKAGELLKKQIVALESSMKVILRSDVKDREIIFSAKQVSDYQNKIWVTRKKPFVDRMASAWLIKKFIDNGAVFKFIDEKDVSELGKNMISFDMRDGEFTHVGDLCTFEVLVKTFGLKDRTLRKISEIVHELDIKDEKYSNPEARGLEDILSGLRKTAKKDNELLEKGMSVFEMLYASKT